jgi:hypothetical protein
MWALIGVGISSVVKCAEDAETQKYVEASAKAIESVIRLPRKSSKLIFKVPVPQTDTGSQGENPKVLEWVMAKELGKLNL